VNRDEHVGANHALEAGGQLHIKAGATLVLEAGQRLTIKGPGGFIDIHPGGVDIVGTVVNINSGGAPGAGPGAHPEAPLAAEEAHPKDTPSP
jgi:type VI secretion system secreted protein VgrG